MTEFYGKDVVLRVGTTNVICFRSLTITINGEAVDLTDGCSQGFRELARDPAVKSLDFAVEGIAKTRTLRAAVLSPAGGRYFENASLVFPPIEGGSEGDTISGDFYLADYSEGVTYDNATTFSATLQSSGVYTYTPEA